jgi:hypothetical protein
VGRSAELRELLSSAISTKAPLVNLVGPSKIGRTSFLLRFADIALRKGKGTDLSSLFEPRQRLIAPYLKLGDRRESRTIRETIARAIADEMLRHGVTDGVPSTEDLMGPAAIEIITDAMTDLGNNTLFVLLVDEAEQMLVADSELARDPWAGGAADTIAVLNTAVESFGVVLAFGTSGPVSKLDAVTRERLEQDFLLTISRLLDRVLGRVELGLLDRDDAVELARRCVVHVPGTGDTGLDEDEVEWLTHIAGGHPFVLHRAGSLAWMMKTSDPRQRRTRDDVEKELVLNLAPLVRLTARRLPQVAGVFEAVTAVAERAIGADLPAAVAQALASEGLGVVGRPEPSGLMHCRIPSPAIRAALRNELESQRGKPTVAAPGSTVIQLPWTVATLDSDGRLRSARINDAEYRLLARLLAAEPDAVTSREELQDILGEGHQQLVQRLSVLRKKIREELGLPNAIENVYGRGYCVADGEGLLLRGS